MREPTGSTLGTIAPERADVRSDSDAMQTGDTPADDAAARMEQVIDQFVRDDWDREDRPQVEETVSAYGETGLAPHSLGGPQLLPRIVTSALPSRPQGLPHNDYWRWHLLDAQSEADEGVPTESASPPPPVFLSKFELASTRRDRTAPERRHQHLAEDGKPSPVGVRWRTAQRLFVAALAATCVFSTGVLWATHRSETVAETGGQPAVLAAAIPESSATGGAMPRKSARNKPVLIREAEVFTLAPGLAAASWRQLPADPPTPTLSAFASPPRLFNSGEAAHSLTAPIAPVVRLVPVVPMPVMPIIGAVPLVPSSVAVASGPAIADAIASSPLPLHSESLTPVMARSDKSPDRARASTRRAEPQRRAATKPPPKRAAHGSAPARRVSSASAPSRAVTRKAARGAVPAVAWEMKRQGLRVIPPEPEPSPLKKLIGVVWPLGQSSTTPESPKRAGPSITTPAVTMPAHSWSDSARANP
jgi:hypothetical protein